MTFIKNLRIVMMFSMCVINICHAQDLFEAVDDCNLSAVEKLIRSGVNANSRNSSMESPLHIACDNDDFKPCRLEIVDRLLRAGADVNALDEDEVSALMEACETGYFPVVKRLIESNAKVDFKDEDGKHALGIACLNGYDDIVKLLLTKGLSMFRSLGTKKKVSAFLGAAGSPETFRFLNSLYISNVTFGKDFNKEKKDSTIYYLTEMRRRSTHNALVSSIGASSGAIGSAIIRAGMDVAGNIGNAMGKSLGKFRTKLFLQELNSCFSIEPHIYNPLEFFFEYEVLRHVKDSSSFHLVDHEQLSTAGILFIVRNYGFNAVYRNQMVKPSLYVDVYMIQHPPFEYTWDEKQELLLVKDSVSHPIIFKGTCNTDSSAFSSILPTAEYQEYLNTPGLLTSSFYIACSIVAYETYELINKLLKNKRMD